MNLLWTTAKPENVICNVHFVVEGRLDMKSGTY